MAGAGSTNSNDNGGFGFYGAPGAAGGTGGAGQSGSSGADGKNQGTGAVLSGGGGGAGQGGGGGGAGGIGGGGGAGYAFGTGGNGGNGGNGGLDGSGNSGTAGGDSGLDGAGGGAVELSASGSITINGSLVAKGAPGGRGAYGSQPQGVPESLGLAGQAGVVGSNGSAKDDSYGGNGGNGGSGGNGGLGGPGGSGGAGGAGAGGTFVLSASSVDITNATINVSGGDGQATSNGRFTIAANNANFGTPSALTGSPVWQYTGTTSANFYAYAPNTSGPNGALVAQTTPNISDLQGGGANAFGILANLSATDPSLAPLRSAAPTGALGALIINGTGLPGYSEEFTGYQWVFFVNLSGRALNNVSLGFDSTGQRTNVSLGLYQETTSGFNIALQRIASLQSGDIFSFLVPTGQLSTGLFNVSADGATSLHVRPAYEFGNVTYLMPSASNAPEPSSILSAGLSLLIFAGIFGGRGNRRWARRRG